MHELIGKDNLRIGIYVRESRDDNGENYETIETQRDLLLDFVEKNRLGIVKKVYIDDNASGSSFERKGLLDLKEDVLESGLDLVLLKDLSRLGRNNAKTLFFLDFLEECGVRVLTFDGKYDSLKDNDTVGIETWINERYIKDISNKIRANIRFKIQKGEYVGNAPYGYKKSLVEKNKLVVDEDAAKTVKYIYELYIDGEGYSQISKRLTKEGIISPGAHDEWNAVAVMRILSNRVYIGDTIQGVSEKISFKSKKTRRLPKDKWVFTEETHEGIISKDKFQEVCRIRESRRVYGTKKSHSSLGSVLFCGNCGSRMYKRVARNRPSGYICSNYMKNGSAYCKSHRISEEYILQLIRQEFIALLMDNEGKKKALDLLRKSLEVNFTSVKKSIVQIENDLEAKRKQQEVLYLDRLENKVSEELFIRVNATFEKKIKDLENELKDTKVKLLEEDKSAFEGYGDLSEDFEFTCDLANELVERIVVFEAGDGLRCDDFVTEEELGELTEQGGVLLVFKY